MMKMFFVFFLLLFNISSVNAASSKFKVTLDKCVDGDTAKFNIKGEVKTVRFLAINTPEIRHGSNEAEFYGDEASKFTCDVLKSASSIKLQYDPKSEQVDKYGRALAWVFVDGDLLQEKLVREGYAEVKYVYDDYLYSSKLEEFENEAKSMKIGMWASGSINDTDDFVVLIISGISALITSIFVFLKKKIKKIYN